MREQVPRVATVPIRRAAGGATQAVTPSPTATPRWRRSRPTSTRWPAREWCGPDMGFPAVGDGEGYCPRRPEDRRRNRRKVSGITRPRMRIKAGMEIHVRAICGATRRTVRFHQRPRAGSMLPRSVPVACGIIGGAARPNVSFLQCNTPLSHLLLKAYAYFSTSNPAAA
jgi:hypothetical protein